MAAAGRGVRRDGKAGRAAASRHEMRGSRAMIASSLAAEISGGRRRLTPKPTPMRDHYKKPRATLAKTRSVAAPQEMPILHAACLSLQPMERFSSLRDMMPPRADAIYDTARRLDIEYRGEFVSHAASRGFHFREQRCCFRLSSSYAPISP